MLNVCMRIVRSSFEWVHITLCVYMYGINVCGYMYVCMYVCMYGMNVCVCVCMYVCDRFSTS